MSYQDQYERSKDQATLERIEIAVLKHAAAVAATHLATPPLVGTQDEREALLAYDVIHSSAGLARRFARFLLADNHTINPRAQGTSDAVILNAVAGSWSAVAGVVNDTRGA